jgi:hypothetical protein
VSTTTALATSVNPSVFGQVVTFTAAVTGSGPTGSASFFDGADADYFQSLRGNASELWITLNRDLIGATNHLEVLPSCSPAPAPTIQASGPTTFCAGESVTLR